MLRLQGILLLGLLVDAERLWRGHDRLQREVKQRPSMETYLASEELSKYVQSLDKKDAAVVRSVTAVEEEWSEDVILYHTASPYIFFLAWLLDSLVHDRPVSYDLRNPDADTSYALVNVTFRALNASATFPSTPPDSIKLNNQFASDFSNANLTAKHVRNVTDFLRVAKDLGALSFPTFDHLVGVRERLLSTNLNLFGNCVRPGDCSWDLRFTFTSWAPSFGSAGNFLKEIFQRGAGEEVQRQVEAQLDVVGCILAARQLAKSATTCPEILAAAGEHFSSSLTEKIQVVAGLKVEDHCVNRWLSWGEQDGDCSRGVLLQLRLNPKTAAQWAYLAVIFGVPAGSGDFLEDYQKLKNTAEGDLKQARLLLMRDFIEGDPPQIAMHHPMTSHSQVMEVVVAMANEIRQVLRGTAAT